MTPSFWFGVFIGFLLGYVGLAVCILMFRGRKVDG